MCLSKKKNLGLVLAWFHVIMCYLGTKKLLKVSKNSNKYYVATDHHSRLSSDHIELGYEGHLDQTLKKKQKPYEIKPIEYFSKNNTMTQCKYSTTEKEMLAVVMTVENFNFISYRWVKIHHLYGSIYFLSDREFNFL